MSDNTTIHTDFAYAAQHIGFDLGRKTAINNTIQETIPILITSKSNDESKKIMKQQQQQQQQQNDSESYCQLVNVAVSTSTSTTNEHHHRTAICSICNCSVKFPSRMSYLQHDYNQTIVNNNNNKKMTTKRKDGICSTDYGYTLDNTKTWTVELDKNKTTSADSTDENNDYNNDPNHYYKQQQQQQQDQLVKSCEEMMNPLRQSYMYLFEFLSSSAYEELCKVEHHGVNNMHNLRKEISESWGILSAIRQQLHKRFLLKQNSKSTDSSTSPSTTIDEMMNHMIVIDLCSGKCLTTTILSILYPNSIYLAIDKLPHALIPHHLLDKSYYTTNLHNQRQQQQQIQKQKQKASKFEVINTIANTTTTTMMNDSFDYAIGQQKQYWSCDIMNKKFLDNLQQKIRHEKGLNENSTTATSANAQSNNSGNNTTTSSNNINNINSNRIVVLVGMHLCGNLSLRAIEIFETIKLIDIVLLCPCCLPKRRKTDPFFIHTQQQQRQQQQQQRQNQNNDGSGTVSTKIVTNKDNKYKCWVQYLKDHVQNVSYVKFCNLFQDTHMNTEKNSIIVASR